MAINELKIIMNYMGNVREAKAQIEKRAAKRYTREKVQYDQRMAERAEKEERTGTKNTWPQTQAPGQRSNKLYRSSLSDHADQRGWMAAGL